MPGWEVQVRRTVPVAGSKDVAVKTGVGRGAILGQSAFELAAGSPTATDMLRRGLAGEEFRDELRIGGRVLDIRSRAVSDPAVVGGPLLLLATDITARVQAVEVDILAGSALHPAVPDA